MSGKTEMGPAKYPTTSDLQSGYFWSVLFLFLVIFFVSQSKNWPLTTYCTEISFGPVKVSSLQDLLSSEISSKCQLSRT